MATKKILFVLVLITTCWLSSFAQEQDRWSIGPRVGVNWANVTNVDDSKALTGLVLGPTITYSINESSGITFDILYSGEGYKVAEDEYKIRYLQIPIYYDFFFGELGNAFRPKVYVGVQPGFFLNAKTNDTENTDDFYNKFVLGLSGGLGFNLRVANKIWLNTDLRSNIGLSDVRASDFQTGDDIKPRTVQLSLGLCYGFSKLD
jgi:hypothetical protein